ncbi:MAG: hypothetical protein B7Z37_19290 [Verrucomicrobia bacterium 12-59-8]|nr:MAG: hypothetical protein B7Z37_19290 [Verrucomicrobia bacterium 12-59-8]
MIPVSNPIAEPQGFDDQCRRPGLKWLRGNRNSQRFPAHWTRFQPALAEAFKDRCGWWAMRIADGDVDHYLSKKNHRRRAYQWKNYRYIAGTVNSSKGNHDEAILDPFQVGVDWFEIDLPSMQLKPTANVPPNLKAKVQFTLKQLKLVNGLKVRRNRKRWYEDYKKHLADPGKGISIGALEEYAPLIAQAVKKLQSRRLPLP